jgi:hypothetical protein
VSHHAQCDNSFNKCILPSDRVMVKARLLQGMAERALLSRAVLNTLTSRGASPSWLHHVGSEQPWQGNGGDPPSVP